MADQARLIPLLKQPGVEEFYPLKDDQTTVGRHPTNDVVLALDSISRFHGRVDKRGEFYIIQDLNSSNGCFVNSERVTTLALHDSDQVTFGNVEFRFENQTARSSAHSTPTTYKGADILDIRDDRDDAPPTTKSTLKVEEVTAKSKSSVIGAVPDKRDRNSLVKLNQRISTLYRLSELLRELENDSEEGVLQRVLDVAFGGIGASRGVILTRFHKESENLDVTAVKYRDQPITPQKVSVSRTILNQVLKDKVAILTKDVKIDDRFNTSESIVSSNIASTISAPMIINGDVLGILHIETSIDDTPFQQEDLEFVSIIANEVGVALANVRMHKESVHRSRLAAVGETVAGISHNVKNILLLSQGGAELLSRAIDRKDLDGARDAWQVVSRGIDKIGKLVRDMLEYSQNKDSDLSEVDPNDLVVSIAEEVEKQLTAKGVTLELDLDESFKHRLLDESGLTRTVMNLIVNSLEAITHKQGMISVTTNQRADKALVISVRDNGAGISPDKLEKIFLPFFTTKGSNGTGLGLSMCKKCIEDMQGTITCESTENVGTAFTIIIPIQTEA